MIREFTEMPSIPTPERDELTNQLLTGLRELDPEEAFPVYYKILEEKFDSPHYVNYIMRRFLAADGENLASYGYQEALDWARKVFREKETGEGFDKATVILYLIQKGDERDIEIIPFPSLKEPLAIRVAGTNLVGHSRFTFVPLSIWFSCLPSVTNTGPQALYVQAILRQYWENMEESHILENERLVPFRDPSEIPAELLTMVVWFDEDGNPVCNVDLSKYGLSMPVIEPKPTGADPISLWNKRTVTFPPPSEPPPPPLHKDDVPTPSPETPPPNRLWLYVGIPSALCATLFVAYNMRQRNAKN